MNLRTFFKKLAKIFNGKLEIEEVAQKELKSYVFDCRFENDHGELPKSIKEVMRRDNAHSICQDILRFSFDWRPPETSKEILYQQHSTFKSHVELLGPDGLVKSEVVRIGLYGMQPYSEYGVRTHPAEELYIMLAGDCLWQRGAEQYKSLTVNERSYHPPFIPHSSKTQANAFMSVYVWHGDLSKDRYLYEGIP